MRKGRRPFLKKKRRTFRNKKHAGFHALGYRFLQLESWRDDKNERGMPEVGTLFLVWNSPCIVVARHNALVEGLDRYTYSFALLRLRLVTPYA